MTSIVTVAGERFLDKGVQPGMQVLITFGGSPVGPGFFDIVTVTQETLEVDPSVAAGTYDIVVSTAFLDATTGGVVVGLPVKQAI